eukprot:scaffold13118_cov36-Prasinocladus_malaysianus.AAC.1
MPDGFDLSLSLPKTRAALATEAEPFGIRGTCRQQSRTVGATAIVDTEEEDELNTPSPSSPQGAGANPPKLSDTVNYHQ